MTGASPDVLTNAEGSFAVLLIVLGLCMTFHRHLVGQLVGAVLIIGPAALLLTDAWLH